MKRLLAALLTLSMLVGIVPFSAFAESPGAVPETFAAAQESPGLDDETVQSIASDPLLQGQYAPPQQAQPTVNSNVSMEATDSFGKLLMNSIDSQNSASSSENRVIGVTVDGSTATVEYVAAEDADIVVALYTDDSEELMSASGTAPAFVTEDNTGSSTATVSLTGSIPNSFVVKAFLLDTVEHAPLSNEFTSNAYTKDIQDLDNATTADYPADRVVNLDDDTTTNFAVVNEDTVLVDANDASTGAMDIADNGDGSYTITNADDRTKNLQPGENFAYQQDDTIFILRVETVDVSGNDVTITGSDDLDLVDVFDVVKIESDDDGSDLEYDSTGVDDEVTYSKIEEDSPLDETNSLIGDSSFSISHQFTIGTDSFYNDKKESFKEPADSSDPDTFHPSSKLGLNAVVKMSITSKFSYTLSGTTQNFKYTLESELHGGIQLALKSSVKFDISQPLGSLKQKKTGLIISYAPQLVVKADITGEIYFASTSKQGFVSEGQSVTQIDEKPIQRINTDISGTVYVGVELAPKVEISMYKWFKPRTDENIITLAKAELSLSIGIEATGKYSHQYNPVEANQITGSYSNDSAHACVKCISIDLSAKIKLTLTLKLIGIWDNTYSLIDYTVPVWKGYISFDFNDTGSGDCPHKLYCVTISIDTTNSPVGTEVFATDKAGNTYSIGTLVGSTDNYCYMKSDTYFLKAMINGVSFTGTVTVDSGSAEITLHHDASTGNVTTAGTIGGNLKWTLGEDGILTISGTGRMPDFYYTERTDSEDSHTTAPWGEYADTINAVFVSDSVENVGAYSFYSCTNVSSVSLSDRSITDIGDYAFAGCVSLPNIILPSRLRHIGQFAFAISGLTEINIPDSVRTVDQAAFAICPNLKKFTLGNGLTEISDAVFGVTALETAVIPEGITRIGVASFSTCKNMTSVQIPASVRSIDKGAFEECPALTDVYYNGTSNMWKNISIASDNPQLNVATIHCTDGTITGTSVATYAVREASVIDSLLAEAPDALTLSPKLPADSIPVFEENNISISTSSSTGNDHSFAASFSDLTPGVSYAVIVSRSEIDPLAPENLIYINQFRASSSDYQQSFQTKRSSTVTENDMLYVVAAGSRVFEDTSVNPGGGGSSSGGGGGGGGGAAVLIGVGAAAAITAGVIMMSPVDVKGRVVLADQAAVPGAKISLLREGKVVAQTTADENGSFSLKAKRGSYELTAAYTTADGQLIYKTIDIKAPAKDLTVTF